MKPHAITQSVSLNDGRTLSIEVGRFAPQASGSAMIRLGDTMLLATVVERKEEAEGAFLPLSVDYQEKFFAGGKIPGGFLKREGRLTEHEILVSRLVDRTIRPCFPDGYFHSVQVMISLLSVDDQVPPDTLAVLAASSAIAVSSIPFSFPVAAVRIGRVEGTLFAEPSTNAMKASDLNMVVGAGAQKLLMLEGAAQELQEEELLEVLTFAQKQIKPLCEVQEKLAKALKIEKDPVEVAEEHQAFNEFLKTHLYPLFQDIALKALPTKQERSTAFAQAEKEVLEKWEHIDEENPLIINKAVSKVKKEVIRALILQKKKRLDGRTPDQIREIDIEVDLFPKTHGSALFSRGQTQVMANVTLGSKTDAQLLDGVASFSGMKEFMLHYNFPGFSTGEVRPSRGVGRREIGHGNLAYRAIASVLPHPEDHPYTIRVVADTLSSDGSSSMATVCSSVLALMDAGVPLSKSVAGAAMGIILDPTTQQVEVLTDILSDEDFCGDADFKVTGTRDGITACQMDIKADGMPIEAIRTMLNKAKVARIHILEKMAAVLPQSRKEKKPHAPVITAIKIKPSMIGAVIGPKGKVIQEMQEQYQVDITISDDGNVCIFGPNRSCINQAVEKINLIVAEPELNHVYKGKVKSVLEYGAFIEFLPGQEGLLHVSEVSGEMIEDLSTELKEGDTIDVKLVKILKPRDKHGKPKFSLSRKALKE